MIIPDLNWISDNTFGQFLLIFTYAELNYDVDAKFEIEFVIIFFI